jgi:hypothetical protein
MASLIKRKLMGIPYGTTMPDVDIDKHQDLARTGLAGAGAAILGGVKMWTGALKRRGVTKKNMPAMFDKLDRLKKLVKEQHDALRPRKYLVLRNGLAPEDLICDPDVLSASAARAKQLLTKAGLDLIGAVRGKNIDEHQTFEALNNQFDEISLAAKAISRQTTLDMPIIESWANTERKRQLSKKNHKTRKGNENGE